MAFEYNNALADYTASFPTSVFSPYDFRNLDESGFSVTNESFNVPASSPYKMNLDFVPLSQSGMTITVGGNARTVIPFGETVGAGEVAVSFVDGTIEFNSADASGAVLATYTAKGSPLQAFHFNQLGSELEAVQDYLDSNDFMTGPGSSTDNAVVTFDGTGGDTLQETGITIDDSNNLSGAASLTGTVVRGGSGSAASPSISFSTDTDTGLYRSSADTLGIAVSGSEAVTIDSSTFTSSKVLSLPDGDASTPSVGFSTAGGIGLYYKTTNTAAFSANSNDVFIFNSAYIESKQPFRIPDGAEDEPGIAFASEDDSGLYYDNGAMSVAIQGAETFTIGSSSITSKQQHLFQGGSAGSCAIAFEGDTNTGIYSTGADALLIANGGDAKVSLNGKALQLTSESTTTPSQDGGNLTLTTGGGTGSGGSGGDMTFTTGAGLVKDGSVTFNLNQFLVEAGDFSINGAYDITLDAVNDFTISASQVEFDNGSASSPVITFDSDTNTGLYRSTTDTLAVSAGGSQVATFGTSKALFLNQIEIQDNANDELLILDQNHSTAGFINFEGNGNNIKTNNGDGAVVGPKAASTQDGWSYAGMIKVNINGGAIRWIPYFLENEVYAE